MENQVKRTFSHYLETEIGNVCVYGDNEIIEVLYEENKQSKLDTASIHKDSSSYRGVIEIQGDKDKLRKAIEIVLSSKEIAKEHKDRIIPLAEKFGITNKKTLDDLEEAA